MFECPDLTCAKCPRLLKYRNENKIKYPTYYNGPVESFGDLSAEILVVGLAPGLNGANQTNRPFTNDYAGVCLTKDNKAVFQNIERLNEHIKDDDKLESEYIKAISTTKPLWKSLLNPYQSKFLNRLVRLGLLPSFVNDSRRNRLYNIVSCESHREKLLTLLNIELKHE